MRAGCTPALTGAGPRYRCHLRNGLRERSTSDIRTHDLGWRSWGTCAPRRPSHGCDVLDRDRVSVDSGRVQGLELGLGRSAHQAKVGAIPDLWPQPGGYWRGEQLGRVVHQHGVVAGR